ncbi:type II secretion system F family protein [[Actinomadura] parvosata]|uniref:type II secretion system F family protein n=2 Tax=[Actinomadura] parvosata TaxID=1955412 RepID=UPI0009ADFC64|nr:type II secretion system F family protein [Nonomuraea sp. ATCC 55076]
MFQLLSAICATLSAWLWLSPRTPADRLTKLHPPKRTSTSHPTAKPHETPHLPPNPLDLPPWQPPTQAPPRLGWLTRRTALPATCVGLLSALLIGGTPGALAALLITPATALFLHRRQPSQSHLDRQRTAADLPFAADLMTACLRAGRPVAAATETTAKAIGGPVGERLTWASTQLRLGADPDPTWASLAKDPAMGQLARAMSRATQSGAPMADVLTRLSDDARDASRATAVAAARSVGVKAVAPLGLCFLPAFVLLGIIPVVAGLASAIVLP